MRSIAKVKSRVHDYEVKVVSSLCDVLRLTTEPNTVTFVDANVARLYPDLNRHSFIPVDCVESTKTMPGAGVMFDHLLSRRANSKTHLVAIGGGVLQDVIGYCASTYCRGVTYTLVPTTLLAQADSCVGGKTSLNHGNRKNILGTFYPPTEILIYPKFTETLTVQDYISGLGEVYKFHILQNRMKEFDPSGDVERMIVDGLSYKIDIISRDEFDRGERRFLNFGHTFGHALEITSDHAVPHGIAVVLGSMIAAGVSHRMGCTVADYDLLMDKGRELVRKSGVSIDAEWLDFASLLEIAKADKKSNGNLTMVLIDGSPFLTEVKDQGIVSETIKDLQCEHQTSSYST